MNQLTRTLQSRQAVQKKASRFISNSGVVTAVLTQGYLPIRHDSLPVPFKSFEVETIAGKRYIVQIRGLQAFRLNVSVGQAVDYDGRYIFPQPGKGGFMLASWVKTSNDKDLLEYVKVLSEAKVIIERSQAEAEAK